MMIRRKHFALSVGYDISTDCPMGFTLALGHRNPRYQFDYRYRFVVSFSCDWPKVRWLDDRWALNEPGYVQGSLPVQRMGYPASAWTGRRYWLHSVSWYRTFRWTVNR